MLRSVVAIALLTGSLSAIAQTAIVPPELWDRPRTARAVLEQDNLRRVINAGLEKPDSQLVIHHTSGQEPLLQAEELKSWLTALAIDSRRVVLRADGVAGSPLRIEIAE